MQSRRNSRKAHSKGAGSVQECICTLQGILVLGLLPLAGISTKSEFHGASSCRGETVPQPLWFYDAPHFATLMGNPNISGP
jgi:hypothetical protein